MGNISRYLDGKGQGRCVSLTGDVLLAVIEIGERGVMPTRMGPVTLSVAQAGQRLEREGKAMGASLRVYTRHFSAVISGVHDYKNRGGWLREVFDHLGFGGVQEFQEHMKRAYKCKEVAPLLCFASEGRAYAVHASLDFPRSDEYAVIFRNSEPHCICHEVMHLFGARDLYYPEAVYAAALRYLPDSIMCDSRGKTDDLTAYAIGWMTGLTPRARAFLTAVSGVTDDDIRAALEIENRDGFGIKKYPDRKYSGRLCRGIPHGKGTMEWYSGVTYRGDWANGCQHGAGTMTWPDGASYEGQWIKGQQEGYGVMRWANGCCYRGKWQEGRMTGIGLRSWPDGPTETGEFRDGQLVDGKTVFADGTVKVTAAGS